jgi:hypothetical protein
MGQVESPAETVTTLEGPIGETSPVAILETEFARPARVSWSRDGSESREEFLGWLWAGLAHGWLTETDFRNLVRDRLEPPGRPS